MAISQIQGAFSLGCNLYTVYFLAILLLVYGLVIWFILILSSIDGHDFNPIEHKHAWNQLFIPIILGAGLIPMIFAASSMVLLINNIFLTKDYTTLTAWHRDSLYRLIQVIFFSGVMLPFLIKMFGHLVKVKVDPDKEHFTRDDMKECFGSILVLGIFLLITMLLNKHRNQVEWTLIGLSCITQFIFLFVDDSHLELKNCIIPGLIGLLVIDLHYLKLSCSRSKRKMLEGGGANDFTYQNASEFLGNSIKVVNQSVNTSKEHADILDNSTFNMSFEPAISAALNHEQLASMKKDISKFQSKSTLYVINTVLILHAFTSLICTVSFYYYCFFFTGSFFIMAEQLLYQQVFVTLGLLLVVKAFCMVPFITFEYYLIIFEHIFVDTSHYQAHLQFQIEKFEYQDMKRQNMTSNLSNRNSRISAAPASGFSVSSLSQNQNQNQH